MSLLDMNHDLGLSSTALDPLNLLLLPPPLRPSHNLPLIPPTLLPGKHNPMAPHHLISVTPHKLPLCLRHSHLACFHGFHGAYETADETEVAAAVGFLGLLRLHRKPL